MLMQLLHGTGLVGFFSSRVFLPAFMTAYVLRFGPQLEWIQNLGLLQHFPADPDSPTWFTSNASLLILGLLAGLEVAATKIPEARQLLQEFDQYGKSAMAMLTYYGAVSVADATFVQETLNQQAGFLDLVPTFAVGAGSYYLAQTRNQVVGLLTEGDEDDDIGVQRLLSWGEDVWSAIGPLFLILFPLFMIGLIALVFGLMWLLRKRAEAKEEQSKVACGQCSEKVYTCAMACPSCGAKLDAPSDIGFFGQSKASNAADLQTHPFHLVEKKRCPVCATRFAQRSVHQKCVACQHDLFQDEAFAQTYQTRIAKRLPLVLGVCFVLSLIPVLGLIPGVIYYRLALVAPFRRYIPLSRSFLLKWAIRLFFIVLIAFQWVPGAGGFVVPIMALVNYVAYSGTFKKILATS